MMQKTFNELNVDPKILKAVNDLGILDLTPIQQVSLPPILEGKDLIGEAPTGTGKTFAYAIPMVNKIPADSKFVHALVITPTRELAFQSADEIRKLLTYKEGIAVVPLYGGSPIQRQIVSLKKKPNIVVGTPGRLLDHIQRGTLKLAHIDTLVLDECDEMLDMGFIKDIERIIKEITNKHQTILFSATISKEIASISSRFQSPEKVSVKVERESRKPIKQWFINVREDEKYEDLIDLLSEINFESAFIFARTKHKVAQLQKKFDSTKFKATSLHGNLNQNKRTVNLRSFKSKENPILIATDIAARGLDVKDVDIVINYDVPEQDEFYIHRIGRVGRANATGESYVFITKAQKRRLSTYEKMTNDRIEEYAIKNKSERTGIKDKEDEEDDRSFSRRGRSQSRDNNHRRSYGGSGYGGGRKFNHSDRKEHSNNTVAEVKDVTAISENKEHSTRDYKRNDSAPRANSGERRSSYGNRGNGENRGNRGFGSRNNDNRNHRNFDNRSRYGEKKFTPRDESTPSVTEGSASEKRSSYGNRGTGENRGSRGFGGRNNDNRGHRSYDNRSHYGEKKFVSGSRSESTPTGTEVKDGGQGKRRSSYGNRGTGEGRSNRGFGSRSNNDNRSHRSFDKSSRYGERNFTRGNKEQSGAKSDIKDSGAKRSSPFNKSRTGGYKGGNSRGSASNNKRGYQNRKGRQ